jgi:hypothetical protein
MNIDETITQLEGKETLLIFLRDNFPDVLEKYRLALGQRQADRTGATDTDGPNRYGYNNK